MSLLEVPRLLIWVGFLPWVEAQEVVVESWHGCRCLLLGLVEARDDLTDGFLDTRPDQGALVSDVTEGLALARRHLMATVLKTANECGLGTRVTGAVRRLKQIRL